MNTSTAQANPSTANNIYPLSNYKHRVKSNAPFNIVQSQSKYTNQRGHDPVMPMKDKNDIARAKDYFLSKPERYEGQNLRDYIIYVLNINIGLRAGDLLHLHINDVMDENGKITQIIIKEQKTINHHKPARVISLAPEIKQMLKDYIEVLSRKEHFCFNDYLFQSRKGVNQPMTVKALEYILKDMKTNLGLCYNVSSHSLRKTFAYQKLMAHRNDAMFLATLQKVLGHSSEKVTLHYCGIEAEEIENVYINDVL